MRTMTTNDIQFLTRLQTELNNSNTKNNTLSLNDPQDLNRLLILIASLNWQNIGEISTIQKAVTKAEEYFQLQPTLKSFENTYISTDHPHRIQKIMTSDTAIRITFTIEMPKTPDTQLDKTRHVVLVYNIEDDYISQ